MSSYYDHTTVPPGGGPLSSAQIRAEFNAVEAGFSKLPILMPANANKMVAVNSGATGLVALTDAEAQAIVGLEIGVNVQAYDADLDALAGVGANGILARTGAGTAAARSIVAPAAGIAITDGDGVAGNPTLALDDDLAALEALGSTGFAVRTGADAWAQREIVAGSSKVTVTNGDGVAGNPTIDVAIGKNAIINGGFTINQRGYVSSATLSSGSYGHDRWKAGSGGGDYTFTQLPSNTQITIESGKTLIQVVEDKNVVGGNYVLSWTGTAQARAGVDSATPSGSYANSPLTISAQTAGTVMSVEFNAGTLADVQLEKGGAATEFEFRMYQDELNFCRRYYEIGNCTLDCAVNSTTTVRQTRFNIYPKRATPTITTSNTNGSPTVSAGTRDTISAFSTATTTFMGFDWAASAEL